VQKLHVEESNNSPHPRSTDSEGFLSYEPLRISDFFLASRLHTWRAIQLYMSLIEEPRWGVYDSSRVVCAVELCRIHAALGIERNFLGAEKACGLYLAGVTWGGPDMYSVSIFLNLTDNRGSRSGCWIGYRRLVLFIRLRRHLLGICRRFGNLKVIIGIVSRRQIWDGEALELDRCIDIPGLNEGVCIPMGSM
jgi:hypothetical protein